MTTNVVHVIAQLDCGGTEKQLLTLASALRDRGWNQTVITFRPDGIYQSRLIGNGIPVDVVPRTRSQLWRFCRFQWLVARRRPAVIHSWSLPTHNYVRLLQWPRKAPIVCEMRYDPRVPMQGLSAEDPVFHDFDTAAYLRNHSRLFGKADYTVGNSQAAISSLLEQGIKPRRAEVVYNMITSLGRGRPGEQAALPRIAAAGTLKPVKGYDVLLRALALLARRGTGFEFLLAGEGPQRKHLEKLALDLGLADSVRFLGGVGDVPGLFASAHVVVHPSYREGLSNSILEAMGEGVPVIASRVGGSPELVRDGETGLLVPPGCPTSITRALQKLLADCELRTRLGTAGLAFVRKLCSVADNVRQYEDIYASLLVGLGQC